MIKQVLALPAGVLFRHCVAGDHWPDPADPLRIDQVLLLQLARATRHLRAAWSFTHYPMSPENQDTVRQAAAKGLVVNASTESRRAAAALVRQGIPVVCVVPSDAPAVFHHEGVRFVACPACRSGAGPRIQCSSCGGRFGRWQRSRDRPTPHRGGRRGMSTEIRLSVVASAGSDVSEVVASQVSVRDLKTHLSEWLGRVQAGEEVEVTSHRKPIARITAVKQADSGISSPMQKAIDAGVISWNGQNPVIPPPVKLNDGGPLISDIVIEDRG